MRQRCSPVLRCAGRLQGRAARDRAPLSTPAGYLRRLHSLILLLVRPASAGHVFFADRSSRTGNLSWSSRLRHRRTYRMSSTSPGTARWGCTSTSASSTESTSTTSKVCPCRLALSLHDQSPHVTRVREAQERPSDHKRGRCTLLLTVILYAFLRVKRGMPTGSSANSPKALWITLDADIRPD